MTRREITLDRVVRTTGLVLLAAGVFFLVRYLGSVLLPFFVAWLFAYLLYPLVHFIQYRLRIRVRALAIMLALAAVGLVAGLVVYLIIPPMIEQAARAGDILTHWIHQTTHTNNLTAHLSRWIEQHQSEVNRFLRSSDFSETVRSVAPRLFELVGQTANVVMSVVGSLITLLYMFFILMDYERLTAGWIRIFPERNRPFWQELAHDVERALNSYIRGQSLVALCMGIMFCIGFTLIDFPMAIGLGILIGILDLVPYLHTFALIPAAFLSMLKAADTGQNFWVVFAVVVLVFIIVQIITDMVVTPRIMGRAMGLNPAILLLALSVWGSLLGFVGLIIALPLTTLIFAYWQRYVTREHTPPHLMEQTEKEKTEKEKTETEKVSE